MNRYHINLFYSEEDAGWIADIPDLEGCSAWGASAQEAIAAVEQAQQLWLEAARERGIAIPRPSYRPPVKQARG
jgi:predicted RNase H-like HicB family nuclease